MKKYFLLAALIFAGILSSCSSTGPSVQRTAGKPIEYFQSYAFSSDLAAVKEAVKSYLKEKGFETEKEDTLQITAVNPELSSVEIINYSLERSNMTRSVFSGEIRVVIDFVETAPSGTMVTARSMISAVVGRSPILKNPDWKGKTESFASSGKLENEILQSVARTTKDKKALELLVTRGVELEGGYTLQYR